MATTSDHRDAHDLVGMAVSGWPCRDGRIRTGGLLLQIRSMGRQTALGAA